MPTDEDAYQVYSGPILIPEVKQYNFCFVVSELRRVKNEFQKVDAMTGARKTTIFLFLSFIDS